MFPEGKTRALAALAEATSQMAQGGMNEFTCQRALAAEADAYLAGATVREALGVIAVAKVRAAMEMAPYSQN